MQFHFNSNLFRGGVIKREVGRRRCRGDLIDAHTGRALPLAGARALLIQQTAKWRLTDL